MELIIGSHVSFNKDLQLKKSVEEARNYFTRISADLINHFSQLGSKCIELEAEDRLRLCHDFYRQGEENTFTFDMIQNMKKGHSFKDFICPDSFTVSYTHLTLPTTPYV